MLPFSIINQYGNTASRRINAGIRAKYTTNPVPAAVNHFGYAYDPDHNIGYICGGYNGGAKSEVWSFNLSTRSWTQLARLPDANYGCSVGYYNGNLYLYGGVLSSGSNNETMYKYNISTNTWSAIPIPTNKPATVAYNKFVSTYDGNFYLWGASFDTSLHRYNVSTNTFTTLASSSAQNVSTGDMCTDGTYLYVQGSKGQKYNILSNTWSDIPLYGSTASRLVYSLYDSSVYCVSYNVLNLGKYDPVNNVWISLYTNSTITGSTGSLFASSTGIDIFYVLGYEGNARTNNQYIFN